MEKPSFKYLQCKIKECYNEERVDADAKSVKCSRCVQAAVGAPQVKAQKISSGRPAGWHFMTEFVDKDGNVFHKGVEQPDLKGTLKPTPAKEKTTPKKRISKEEKLVALHKKKLAMKKKEAEKKAKAQAKKDGVKLPKKKKVGRPKTKKATPKKTGRPAGSKNKK